MNEEINAKVKEEELTEAERVERDLSEKVGIQVDYSTLTTANFLKALIFSGIGVFMFFIPCLTGSKGESIVPMVYLVNGAKTAAAGILNHLVMIVCIGLSITYTYGKINKNSYFGKFHEKDGVFTGILYYLAAIFSTMLVFQVGPEQIVNPDVGGLAISLAGSTLFTVTIAGWLVTFLIEFGILEFIGTLIEPIMRRVFLLPGQSAVDALSSFVAAPAVGVFITNKLYNECVYTEKEACCIMTNFSVVSLGFFALLVSITDTQEMYGAAVLTSLLTVFILAIIVIRIPPLSKKKEQYKNGVMQTAAMKKPGKYDSKIFKRAVAAATTKASGTQYSVFLTAFEDVFSFALKVVAFVQALTVLSMLISTYTPVFEWIGKPMVPYLNLMGLENVNDIAPATLVGISEIALPVMTIAGKAIAPASIFFVIVLSTVQIIFFTESANAMLQSDAGLKVGELVLIFLIRTIIAVPIVAFFAKMLY
ncbi:YjiH family protein [Peptoniphilus catoniae]|uniref:YjiH family protein n=1 Tax=Peptoniphilus catoniae TaxID=1660341 RepID=UPI0010FD3119|nr:nucleoside recognition domain-containing protein [Peptoniphilus catoniae]